MQGFLHTYIYRPTSKYIYNKIKLIAFFTGDSGGPLVIKEHGRFVLVGITSAGFGCGVDHQPGIYHNLQKSLRWVEDVVAHNEP